MTLTQRRCGAAHVDTWADALTDGYKALQSGAATTDELKQLQEALAEIVAELCEEYGHDWEERFLGYEGNAYTIIPRERYQQVCARCGEECDEWTA